MKGLFVTFEGADCSGKSTQAELFVKRLREEGHDVVYTREPGGTPLGEKIRNILLEHSDNPPCGVAEAMLLAAARAQHIADVIKPALEAGKIVVSDRYIDSTYAYQGVGRGIPKVVTALEALVVPPECMPNLTFMFIAAEAVLDTRAAARTEKQDRLDNEQIEFRRKVREAYANRAVTSSRFVIIDGNKEIDTVAHDVYSKYERFINDGEKDALVIKADHEYAGWRVMYVVGNVVHVTSLSEYSRQAVVTRKEFRDYVARFNSGDIIELVEAEL